MYNESNFIEAILDSYQNYVNGGEDSTRSTEKTKPIHHFLANVLKDIFGSDCDIHYNSENYAINPKIVYQKNYRTKKKGELKGEAFKELNVSGKYYNKNIDIAITNSEKKVVFCLGVKFVTSNYDQNSNNYFEGMIGETINIQSKDIPYAHLIIFRSYTPYYKKYKKYERTEEIDFNKLKKYVELDKDDNNKIKPFATAIFMMNIYVENDDIIKDDFSGTFDITKCQIKKVELTDIDKRLEHLSIENLFEKIKGLITI